jgi:creatinine amidohydrolase
MGHLQKICSRSLAIAYLTLAFTSPAISAPRASNSVYLEDLTTTELRARIDAGTTTVLVPIGGTEQSGPHLTLGKHNVRARALAGLIAQRLGQTVVAPTIAYVPEGAIDPPSGHMHFAGTISIPEATFEALLEASARSFCQHGLRAVFFLGDHGGYQKSEQQVAARLNHEPARPGRPACHAYAVLDYYDATQGAYTAELKRRGYTEAEIGLHAGLADTSLMLAIDPSQVRSDQLASGAKTGPAGGVRGDPTRATAELGKIGVQRQVEAAVAAIRAAERVQVDQHNHPSNPSKQ